MTNGVIFRCDASDKIGFGHIIRSYALAEECAARGFAAHFITTTASIGLLRSLGVTADTIHAIDVVTGSTEDISLTAALSRELQASWIVLDGYCFMCEYQANIRKLINPCKLLVLDDGVIDGFDCDLILNQNLGAELSNRYTEIHQADLLLGSSYTLFRKIFRQTTEYTVRPNACNITLTFGGADTHNLTANMLGALVRTGALTGRSTRVILGGAYKHRESLANIPELDLHQVEFVPFSAGIVEHFIWSDLVLAAAGSVAWELALLRVPMALVLAAENQRAVAEPLEARQAALVLGEACSFDPGTAALKVFNLMNDYSARLLLSSRCCEFIDCHGSQRVVDQMKIIS